MKAGLTLLFAILCLSGCADLTPRRGSYEDMMQMVDYTLRTDGKALFGRNPPSFAELRSLRNPRWIPRLVTKLEGPLGEAVAAQTLLFALAVTERERVVPPLIAGFDVVRSRDTLDVITLALMKATRLRTVTIPFPEEGYVHRYKIDSFNDAEDAFEVGETGDSFGKTTPDARLEIIARQRWRQYWQQRLRR